MKFRAEHVLNIGKLFEADRAKRDAAISAAIEKFFPAGMRLSPMDAAKVLLKAEEALARLNLSEREVGMLADALEHLYVAGLIHGICIQYRPGDAMARAARSGVSRNTGDMVKSFTKLRTDNLDQQKAVQDLLGKALPEKEPAGGYEEVEEMLCALWYDFEYTDPCNKFRDARMVTIRDHADALFIDGIVYGVLLAMGAQDK